MKFQPDAATSYSIHSYGEGWIRINGERYNNSLLLSSTEGVLAWDCPSFEDLSETHFSELKRFQPELVLFGSGNRLRFPHPRWLQGLYAQRIGVETMDTSAACRTFNFLVGEGRNVVAALLLESGKP
ncbi:Mth938-like domain-containing protein [Curvibacter sp. APW13]|uniref:Mth938-like domain-containing protein n=1 Tax=Curvibacter sp. APW13 TaxID=3077236 RepID=UPI0028E05408|nr:Mth938-like domain-containing protein [Curvibacter sp. APW13]MDT8992123.1 Mth938-like domain-containing protein [Curvibacter sp. APW13]